MTVPVKNTSFEPAGHGPIETQNVQTRKKTKNCLLKLNGSGMSVHTNFREMLTPGKFSARASFVVKCIQCPMKLP
jgi:hypothetical protein